MTPLLSLSTSPFPARIPRRLFRNPNLHIRTLPLPSAIGRGGKFRRPPLVPSRKPQEVEPPEVPEDSSHGVSKLEQFHLQTSRTRKAEEMQYSQEEALFASAFSLDPDDDESDGDEEKKFFNKAISRKRKEFVKKGLIPPPPPKDEDVLTPEEEADLKEVSSMEDVDDEDIEGEPYVDPELEVEDAGDISSETRITTRSFQMTLAELLDECRVVPVAVYGELEVEITGIQHDVKQVTIGDLFVICAGSETEYQSLLSEADRRGAVAAVANAKIGTEGTLACKALVVLEDTNAALPVLAASFYGKPSRSMSVIGITGTVGKSTTTYLVKGLYEGMALRTGMLSSLQCFLQGSLGVEATETTTPDPVAVQRLMAHMAHNDTEALALEVPSEAMADGSYDEVDFDVAVLTNLTTDYEDIHVTEENRANMAKLFAKMVDPERHRKVVNMDDPDALFFIAQGNAEVPVVTYSMTDKSADVHVLKYELSLFETQVLINTPKGILEISSGLLGKYNIYNILAAVAVGIAVEAPLEDVVKGIEEVDVIPGRCELIDEEQPFTVIVDHAKTPDSLSKLLDTVRELGVKRIITVVGCCGEKEWGKRAVMAKIATDKSDAVILTSDNPGNEDPLEILDDMLAGVGWNMEDYATYGENDYYPPLRNGHRLFVHDLRLVAVRAGVAMGKEGDAVVIAGKGDETFQLEGDKKEFFDDREHCREALYYLDELHESGVDTSEFPWSFPESH